ncbi:MAG: hypothetical protein M3N95_06785 [Actinomycetota bacterium]|nr:hypothetical protein [Actinomycetota bacterium]
MTAAPCHHHARPHWRPITLVVDSAAIRVTLLEEPPKGRRIVTSVTIPLDSLAGVAAGSEITFHATNRGGLVYLAADLS